MLGQFVDVLVAQGGQDAHQRFDAIELLAVLRGAHQLGGLVDMLEQRGHRLGERGRTHIRNVSTSTDKSDRQDQWHNVIHVELSTASNLSTDTTQPRNSP